MAKQSRLPPFLLTRPARQAERFAAMLRARFGAGIEIIESPLMGARLLTPEFPRLPYRALIFTSETGVLGFQQISADPILSAITTAWCVGDQTAQAVREAGLVAHSAAGNLTDLEAAILAAKPEGPLLYLHGRERQADLAKSLNFAGIETVSAVVYAQDVQPLSRAAVDLMRLETDVILPLFSPRTASEFSAQWTLLDPKARLIVVAMSDAVAEALRSVPYAKMIVAKRPDALAMLDAIAEVVTILPDA